MRKRTVPVIALALAALMALSMMPAAAQEDPNETEFFGLTTADEIVTFSADADGPDDVEGPWPVTGLDDGDSLVGLDARPATGQLVGATTDSRVVNLSYVEDTGFEVTYVEGSFADDLDFDYGTGPHAFDFNPTVDLIRAYADGNDNARVDPNDGSGVEDDGDVTYIDDGPDDPNAVATAYTNSVGVPETTTQFAIDSNNNVALAELDEPNDGTLLAPTQITANGDTLTLADDSAVGFDIVSDGEGEDPENNSAFVAVHLEGNDASTFHSLDLDDATVNEGFDTGHELAAVTGAVVDAPGDEGELLWGVTDDNRLVQFGSESSDRVTANHPITGTGDETVRSVDVRPDTDELFALTSGDQLGTINPATGEFTAVAEDVTLDPAPEGEWVTIDFNPTVDLIRVVSSEGDNLRADPETGQVVDDGVDGDLAYAEDDENSDVDAAVVAAAYTNSVPGAEDTTLYDLEANATTLVTQDPPDDGILNTVAGLSVEGVDDPEPDDNKGFDISGETDTAFVSADVHGDTNGFAPVLHTLDLDNGVLTPVEGTDDEGDLIGIGAPVVSITVAAEDDDAVIRISGDGRLGTAIAVSEFGFDPETTDTVYVATAERYPDAVTSGPSAFGDDAPVVMTGREDLPDMTADEIQRLDPDNIVVMGGTDAIVDDVVEEIDGLNDADTARVFGETRFETAAEISAAAFPDDDVETVYVATGWFFADALTGGALASFEPSGPVLLTHEEIPTAAQAELERLNPDNIVVFGGTEAVPEQVADDLEAFTDGDVSRLSEPDGNRFDTAATILDAFGDADTDRVYVTTGEDFPDALATVPVAAQDQTGIALSGRDQLTESTVAATQAREPSQIVIVGGTDVITEEVEDDLRAIVTGQDPSDEG